jgi:protein CpxP
MKTIQQWTMIILFGLIATLNAVAEPASDMVDGERDGHRMERIAEKLDLSDEQKEQIKVIYKGTKSEMKFLRQSIKESRKAMEAAVESGANDSKIDELSTQQGKLMAEMIALKSKNRVRVMTLLTDEQRVKAKKMRAKMQKRSIKCKQYKTKGS